MVVACHTQCGSFLRLENISMLSTKNFKLHNTYLLADFLQLQVGVKLNNDKNERYERSTLNALLFKMILIYASRVTLGFIFQVVIGTPFDFSTSKPTPRGLGVQHS